MCVCLFSDTILFSSPTVDVRFRFPESPLVGTVVEVEVEDGGLDTLLYKDSKFGGSDTIKQLLPGSFNYVRYMGKDEGLGFL